VEGFKYAGEALDMETLGDCFDKDIKSLCLDNLNFKVIMAQARRIYSDEVLMMDKRWKRELVLKALERIKNVKRLEVWREKWNKLVHIDGHFVPERKLKRCSLAV